MAARWAPAAAAWTAVYLGARGTLPSLCHPAIHLLAVDYLAAGRRRAGSHRYRLDRPTRRLGGSATPGSWAYTGAGKGVAHRAREHWSVVIVASGAARAAVGVDRLAGCETVIVRSLRSEEHTSEL